MGRKEKEKVQVEGEGSYSGTRDYNRRTEKFIRSGKVDDAARAAQPRSEAEAHQMHKAERIGKQHAKGEDSPSAGSAAPKAASGDRSGRSR